MQGGQCRLLGRAPHCAQTGVGGGGGVRCGQPSRCSRGEAVSAQRDGQRAALRALWAVPRILDFIPTEMRSHWKFLNVMKSNTF